MCIITSSRLCLNNESRLCASWYCLLPLIPSIILFSCIVCLLGLASMAKLSPSSHHTYHHVVSRSWSLSTQLLPLRVLSVRASREDQSLALSYSYSIQLLLVRSYLTHLSVIICMLMTINFSFLLSLLNSQPTFYTCKPKLILCLLKLKS